MRWLGVLADEGLVVRENDEEDHRRVLVRLTPAGQTAMDRFFDAFD
ncbi:winged helix DNA-binding protein [Erythrobacter donghaensis]|nr:winged helix DNA-binding protein [Erythrobacter donghaensis]